MVRADRWEEIGGIVGGIVGGDDSMYHRRQRSKDRGRSSKYHLSADDTSVGRWWYGRLMGGESSWALELRRRGSTAVEICTCCLCVLCLLFVLFVCGAV